MKTISVESRFVGLDVHKRSVTYCIIGSDGSVIRRNDFTLSQRALQKFAQTQLNRTDEVALESTTNCWAVAEELQRHVAKVVVSNPMATKAIAQSKIKTDKVDSHVLAQLLRCGFLPEVWQPDEATRLRRQLSGRRASLVQQRTQLRNRIHSVLAMRLITPQIDYQAGLFSKKGREWLDQLTGDAIDAHGLKMIRSDLRLLDSLQVEIDEFDQRLAELAYQDEQVKLLMTMPGISVVVAQAIIAALGDIDRFPTADKAAAYLGLVPSTKQSAKTTYHGPITKQGNSMARWMLIQAAQHMARQNGPLGHFFRRLKRRKNHNIAVVATARKMAMIAWHMLKQNEPYRYSPPRSTQAKLAKIRVAATGQKRQSGVGQGTKAKAKLPGGGRTIKSIDTVYEQEGLPPRKPLAPGEEKYVQESGGVYFVSQIARDQVVPRKKPTPTANPKGKQTIQETKSK